MDIFIIGLIVWFLCGFLGAEAANRKWYRFFGESVRGEFIYWFTIFMGIPGGLGALIYSLIKD